MRLAERGEEGVEDVEEDEDEKEVVILGDAGPAAMRAGAAWLAAATFAAATAGRMEGISLGFGLGAGGWRARPRPGRLVGRSGWQRCVEEAWGCGLCFLGSADSAPAMCEGVCVSVRVGEESSRGLHLGVGGVGSFGLCAGGMCGSLGGVCVPSGVGLLAGGVYWLPGVGGGEARLAGGSVAGVCGCSGG